jgi:hypothetical protein
MYKIFFLKPQSFLKLYKKIQECIYTFILNQKSTILNIHDTINMTTQYIILHHLLSKSPMDKQENFQIQITLQSYTRWCKT